MGVYHLMGLGRSPGAATGPLSYLAHRYQRWNENDQRFFSRSGEVAHREAGKKTGDIQAIVLFSTTEVLEAQENGKPFLTSSYLENVAGKTIGKDQPGRAMKDVLRSLLQQTWPAISGGRKSGDVFWCEIDRRDIGNAYECMVQVVAALAGVGGQGKEMWANLTGGNNVINFATELAATLSGAIARSYYVQAQDPIAEKCVHFTTEDGYWVELPVMPLTLGRLSHAVLDVLMSQGALGGTDLFNRLLNHSQYWNLVYGVAYNTFKELYLTPMWKQGLITGEEKMYVIGPQWELIRPYEEYWQATRQANVTIEQLAQRESWIEREEIIFE